MFVSVLIKARHVWVASIKITHPSELVVVIVLLCIAEGTMLRAHSSVVNLELSLKTCCIGTFLGMQPLVPLSVLRDTLALPLFVNPDLLAIAVSTTATSISMATPTITSAPAHVA